MFGPQRPVTIATQLGWCGIVQRTFLVLPSATATARSAFADQRERPRAAGDRQDAVCTEQPQRGIERHVRINARQRPERQGGLAARRGWPTARGRALSARPRSAAPRAALRGRPSNMFAAFTRASALCAWFASWARWSRPAARRAPSARLRCSVPAPRTSARRLGYASAGSFRRISCRNREASPAGRA